MNIFKKSLGITLLILPTLSLANNIYCPPQIRCTTNSIISCNIINGSSDWKINSSTSPIVTPGIYTFGFAMAGITSMPECSYYLAGDKTAIGAAGKSQFQPDTSIKNKWKKSNLGDYDCGNVKVATPIQDCPFKK